MRRQPLLNERENPCQLPRPLLALSRRHHRHLAIHMSRLDQLIDKAVTDPHLPSNGCFGLRGLRKKSE